MLHDFDGVLLGLRRALVRSLSLWNVLHNLDDKGLHGRYEDFDNFLCNGLHNFDVAFNGGMSWFTSALSSWRKSCVKKQTCRRLKGHPASCQQRCLGFLTIALLIHLSHYPLSLPLSLSLSQQCPSAGVMWRLDVKSDQSYLSKFEVPSRGQIQ